MLGYEVRFLGKWTCVSKCPTFQVSIGFQWLLNLRNLWKLKHRITDALHLLKRILDTWNKLKFLLGKLSLQGRSKPVEIGIQHGTPPSKWPCLHFIIKGMNCKNMESTWTPNFQPKLYHHTTNSFHLTTPSDTTSWVGKQLLSHSVCLSPSCIQPSYLMKLKQVQDTKETLFQEAEHVKSQNEICQ